MGLQRSPGPAQGAAGSQSSPSKVRLAQEGPARAVVVAVPQFGAKPWEMQVSSTSPWCGVRVGRQQHPQLLVVLDCIPGINGKYLIVPFVSV